MLLLVVTTLVTCLLISASEIAAQKPQRGTQTEVQILQEKLQALNGSCVLYDNAGWWSYQLCLGASIKQFHRDKGSGEISGEVSMGTYVRTEPLSRTANMSQRPEKNGRYLSQLFASGDQCTIEGGKQTERKTEVRIFCCHEPPRGRHRQRVARGQTYVHSISEVRTCTYIVSVCTQLTCSNENIPNNLDDSTTATDHVKSEDLIASNIQKEDVAAEEEKNVDNDLVLLSEDERIALRDKVKEMFQHGYDGYMKFAFPKDQLQPVSCSGENEELTAGSMLTLIDSLDSLVVFGNYTEFVRAVQLVSDRANFEIDITVSVFETTIRILGGLLSAHIFATDPDLGFAIPGYENRLLDLAADLGNRLLPAFNTSTSIPYGTVNLKRGVPKGETSEACTAAAGSLSLEFGILSILTREPKYAIAARDALRAIFDLRSNLNLVGRHIDTASGKWTEPSAGIGSNIDSLYEYYIKQYILFGDDLAFEMFEELYYGALGHLTNDARWYVEADVHKGRVLRTQFNSLQCFWPGMQTLVGDLQIGARTTNGFYQIWNDFKFTPEDFHVERWQLLKGGSKASYPLRPELIESTYHLHAATGDPSWLVAGRDILNNIEKHTRTKCGFATIKDVGRLTLEDSMPSFFLAESLKYLYLLFDTSNPIRPDNGGLFVFTTEAHPFPLRTSMYDMHGAAKELNLFGNSHIEVPYKQSTTRTARNLAARAHAKANLGQASSYVDTLVDDLEFRTCPVSRRKPDSYYKAHKDSEKFLPTKTQFKDQVKRDNTPTQSKEERLVADTVEIPMVGQGAGNKFYQLGERLDAGTDVGQFQVTVFDGGFQVEHIGTRKVVGFNSLASDTAVVVVYETPAQESAKQSAEDGTCAGDSTNAEGIEEELGAATTYYLQAETSTAFTSRARFRVSLDGENSQEFEVTSAAFGPRYIETSKMKLDNLQVVLAENPEGCDKSSYTNQNVQDKIVVVIRGTCTFEEKVENAQIAGAAAVIVARVTTGAPFIMSGKLPEERKADDVSITIPSYMISKQSMTTLKKSLSDGSNDGFMSIELNPSTPDTFPYVAGKVSTVVVLVDQAWGIAASLRPQQNTWQLTVLTPVSKVTADKPIHAPIHKDGTNSIVPLQVQPDTVKLWSDLLPILAPKTSPLTLLRKLRTLHGAGTQLNIENLLVPLEEPPRRKRRERARCKENPNDEVCITPQRAVLQRLSAMEMEEFEEKLVAHLASPVQ